MYIPAWPSLNPALFLRSGVDQKQPFPLNRIENHYFYVARNGIYQLFRKLALNPADVVLAPDYHHGNEIYAMQAAGANLRYYPIPKNLELDVEAVARLCDERTRVLYITHFMGWPQPMEAIRELCRERRLLLIEDCALSLLSTVNGVPLGSFGDYSVFCLYKTLPLPNGGVLVKNNGQGPDLAALSIRLPDRLSVGARTSELVLQSIRSRHERTGQFLFDLKRRAGRALSAASVARTPVGDTGFDTSSADIGMSPLCHSLMNRFHYADVVQRRRRNFQFLADRLNGFASPVRQDLAEGVCPLFFPLLVTDKPSAAQALWDRGVDAVEFWNEGDPDAAQPGSAAEYLRRHVLEVPIHQEITEEQLEYMAQQIRFLNIGIPSVVAA